MVRFSDAQEGRKEAMRVGMLNVWDSKALGEGLLEGKRYLVSPELIHQGRKTEVDDIQVSNLMPGRNGDWSVPKPDRAKAEIYLHTRRDSRWQRVKEGSE